MAVSFAKDIRPIYTDEDIDHMSTFLDLSSYDDNKANSTKILMRLKGDGGKRRMPPPPRAAWTPEQIALYQQWINDGYPP